MSFTKTTTMHTKYVTRAFKLFNASRAENCTNKSTHKRKTERFIQYMTRKDTEVLAAFVQLVKQQEAASN